MKLLKILVIITIALIVIFGGTYAIIAIKNPLIIYTHTDESTKEVSYYRYDRLNDDYLEIVGVTNIEQYLIDSGYLKVENEN